MTYSITNFHQYLKDKNTLAIRSLIADGLLKIVDGKLYATDESKATVKQTAGFWDQRQLARKILLNSLYGGLLNQGSRFHDKRLGQSVTLTGRSISKHMNSKANELITGVYDVHGKAIVYADTDSSYFSAYETLKHDPDMQDVINNKEAMLQLYLSIGDSVNESFPPFMDYAFNTGIERGEIIAAGLELVADTSLFIKKKRYAALKYWDETSGRLDNDNKPGKVKAMGLDLKRADTPKIMQEFLEKIIVDILTGSTEDDVMASIRDFRDNFRKLESWQKGTPKKVNGITHYQNLVDDQQSTTSFQLKSKHKQKTITIPGHVRASMNWNYLKKLNDDHYSMGIQDGAKVIVCKLKKNPLNLSSVAYPYDENRLPRWFKELPFDDDLMEETIIDQKVKNLIGVLKWDLSKSRKDANFDDLFEF